MKNYLSFKRGLLTAFIVLISLATTLAVEVTVNFSTSTTDPIQGATIKYNNGSWVVLGITDAQGNVSYDFPDGTTNESFRVLYLGRSITKVQDISIDPFVQFNTIPVTVLFLNSNLEPIDSESIVFNGTSQHTPFGDGTANETIEMLPANYGWRIVYNGTTAIKTQDVSVNPIVEFSTLNVTLKLLNSLGEELESSNARFYGYGGWHIFNDGTSNNSIEILEGNYKFQVFYGGFNNLKYQDISVDPIVIFQTANVNLYFSGNIGLEYGGWINFDGIDEEMLPNTYNFRFYDTGYPYINKEIQVTQSGINKTVEYVKLTNSDGEGMANAPTQYNNNGWKSGSITSSNGSCLNFLEGYVENTTTRLYYGGAYEDIVQNIIDDSFIDFNTVSVSMDLMDSQNNPLASENAEYYANGWQTFGDGVTSESIELLPQAYNFRVSYAKGQNSKMQDISVDPQVSFSTIPVTVNLMDSNGDDLVSTNVMYLGMDGLTQFGDGLTPITKELLPNEYTFRMLYGEAILDKDQDVSMDANVEFSTIPVTMNVYDANGNVLNGTDATYSYSGLTMFGDGTTPSVMELLPVSYDFSVMYDGNPLTTNQNTAFNPNVSFTIEALPALVSMDEDQLFEEEELIMGDEFFENNSPILEAEEIKASTANAYPNPFSESITLSYEVEADAKVNISVYNMNGVLISTLVDGNMHKGNYEVKWNADDRSGNEVPNGTYIYRISIDNKVESNTMILQK